jgi:hypothetical protein
MTPKITIDDITIKNYQAMFTDSIDFEITFTTHETLTHPIEWKITYFGSAKS